jgi:hypothetical protein
LNLLNNHLKIGGKDSPDNVNERRLLNSRRKVRSSSEQQHPQHHNVPSATGGALCEVSKMAWSKSTRITIMLAIDAAFFVLELGVGLLVGSLALMADAFHMVHKTIQFAKLECRLTVV